MSNTTTKKVPTELGTESIGKLLMQYAIPAIIAQIAASLYNLIDRAFIGHIPNVGTDAISGLTNTFPFMNLSVAFGAMIGVGGATLLSVRLGQRDYDSARNILGNLVTLCKERNETVIHSIAPCTLRIKANTINTVVFKELYQFS